MFVCFLWASSMHLTCSNSQPYKPPSEEDTVGAILQMSKRRHKEADQPA